jgi:hypothetical protein
MTSNTTFQIPKWRGGTPGVDRYLYDVFPSRDINAEWKANKGTKDLDDLTFLPHINIDQDALKAFYALHSKRPKGFSWFEDAIIEKAFNLRYCAPEDYWPFVIHGPSFHACSWQDTTDLHRGISWVEHQQTLSPKKRMRSLVDLNMDYDPIIDERHYTMLPGQYGNSFISEFFTQFKSPVCRARFVRLKPGEKVDPHQDYNPKYVLKVLIPVQGYEKAGLQFERRGTATRVYYIYPGAYVVNTGVKHSAFHHGDEDRIYLLLCLDGQADLEGLL